MGLRSIVRCHYVDDNGNAYTFKQEDQLRAAAGNVVATGTEIGPLPSGLRPRKIHAGVFLAGGIGQAVGEFRRALVIGSVTNPLWTNATKTVSLPDLESVPGVGQTTPNVMATFTVTSRIGERQAF